MPEDTTASVTSIKSNFLLKRQLCKNHSDLKFPPYFFGEDFWFFRKLYKYMAHNNFKTVDKLIGWYGTRDNPLRLTEETNFNIPLVVSKLLYILKNPEEDFFHILYRSIIINKFSYSSFCNKIN